MSRNWLLGYASALVLASTVALQAAPQAPAAPKAPPAPTAPRAPAAPQAPPVYSGPVITGPTQRFDVKSIEINDLFGTVRVNVSNAGPVTLALSGPKGAIDKIKVLNAGGALRINEEHMEHVWNWREWFDFKHDRRERVTVNLTAPKGTNLVMDDFVGEFTVGDLDAPVKIGAAAAKGTIGNVQRATIELAGSGNIQIGTVTEQLKIEIAGSGSVKAGASGGASIEISGSGDTTLGPVLGALKVEIAGSGDVQAASANGACSIETAGAGNIRIDTGECNPLKVEMLGSGDLVFGGEAVNPDITAMGSGNVTLKSYRGRLSTEGMTHVKIGSKD